MTTESCPKLREETSNSCHVSRQACYHVRRWSCQGWLRASCLSREEGEKAYSGEMASVSRCTVQKKEKNRNNYFPS